MARDFAGCRLEGVKPLTGGVSATLTALQLEGSDPLVVREHPAAPMEVRLLRTLALAGFPVPEVRGSVQGRAAYVMAFIEGTTELEPHEIPAAIPQMADFLARLHALRPVPRDLPDLEDPQVHLPAFIDSAGRLAPQLREALVSRGPWESRNEPALLHGDYWPGNVLWNAGRLAAVIDWEDAAVGDPNADLAGARIELACRYDDEVVEAFTARYLAKNPIDTHDLPLWEVYSACAALASMAAWGLPPEVEAERRARTTRFLEKSASAWMR